MNDVTRMLRQIDQGDRAAAEQLLPLLYDELRQLAAAKLAHERPGQTLQATALVHEAYVRLVAGGQEDQRWEGRGHFFAAAAEAMRRILVESARRKKRLKHGGEFQRASADELDIVAEAPVDEILAVDEALDRLAAADGQAAQVVKLHFFAGLTLDETARLMGISTRTAYRDWAFARAWLAKRLDPGHG